MALARYQEAVASTGREISTLPRANPGILASRIPALPLARDV